MDKELIARGAVGVAGDLMLGRDIVGQYRNGVFALSDKGRDILENQIEVEAVEVKPAPKPRAPKQRAVKDVVDSVSAGIAADIAALDDDLGPLAA